MLELKNISISYGKQSILDGFSLNVQRGEVVAVVGPNGAGKTTLFKCAAGLLKPNSGTVAFSGRSVKDLQSADIGWILRAA